MNKYILFTSFFYYLTLKFINENIPALSLLSTLAKLLNDIKHFDFRWARAGRFTKNVWRWNYLNLSSVKISAWAQWRVLLMSPQSLLMHSLYLSRLLKHERLIRFLNSGAMFRKWLPWISQTVAQQMLLGINERIAFWEISSLNNSMRFVSSFLELPILMLVFLFSLLLLFSFLFSCLVFFFPHIFIASCPLPDWWSLFFSWLFLFILLIWCVVLAVIASSFEDPEIFSLLIF